MTRGARELALTLKLRATRSLAQGRGKATSLKSVACYATKVRSNAEKSERDGDSLEKRGFPRAVLSHEERHRCFEPQFAKMAALFHSRGGAGVAGPRERSPRFMPRAGFLRGRGGGREATWRHASVMTSISSGRATSANRTRTAG